MAGCRGCAGDAIVFVHFVRRVFEVGPKGWSERGGRWKGILGTGRSSGSGAGAVEIEIADVGRTCDDDGRRTRMCGLGLRLRGPGQQGSLLRPGQLESVGGIVEGRPGCSGPAPSFGTEVRSGCFTGRGLGAPSSQSPGSSQALTWSRACAEHRARGQGTVEWSSAAFFPICAAQHHEASRKGRKYCSPRQAGVSISQP